MKPIGHGGYLVRPYKVYKQHSYIFTYPSASDASGRVNIDEALPAIGTWIWDTNEPVNADGIYKRPLHRSVRSRFYSSSSLLPAEDAETIIGWIPGAEDPFYVVNVSQQGFGEGIRPGSFTLSNSGSTVIRDDGYGRLYVTEGSYIGNVFYGSGIAVVQKASGSLINTNGLFINTGAVLSVGYDSTVTIQEHTVVCTIEAGEMNWSSNPTINPNSVSSSISGSNPIIREFVSGSLTPYMTTIGLYNSIYELVAVAKVPKPIKRTPEMSQTFVVRFDI